MGFIKLLFLVALGFATPPAVADVPKDDAAHWRNMARDDLAATHALIVSAHPGVIDTGNPQFNAWVEDGYVQAQALIPYAMSYDTAMDVVRFYTIGFEDGHLVYSDNARRDYPIYVTGWNIVRKNEEYVVSVVLPDGSTPLPPKGAVWIGCDGLSADAVLQTRVAPFVDRRPGDQSAQSRVNGLWLRRPIAENLRECKFLTKAGTKLRIRVHYQPITITQLFAARPSIHDGNSRAPNSFDIKDGLLWVRAGNFNLRADSPDTNELEKMLSELVKVDNVKALVFDSRGNRGGDSGVGDRIFEAATGGLEFDQRDLDKLPRYYAQWRVSDFLVSWLGDLISDFQSLYGPNSPRVSEQVAFRASVIAAKAAGQSWVEQDAGHRITRDDVAARNGHLHRINTKVALLTDSGCVSACLDFVDVVLQVPGVVHLGETTGADSVYMVGARSRLQSGNVLVMPVKVWRNRARGNNQQVVPDVPLELGATDDAAIRRAVLDALHLN